MVDRLSTKERSALMARIGSRDTGPELTVRRLLHSLGFRFRLQRADLPGRPDIVLSRSKKVIFVHGCFWHQHAGCRKAALPKTREDFWRRKLERNAARDHKAIEALLDLGWNSCIIWECETKDPDVLKSRITAFMTDQGS
jgi:DNA mismatch endonuclease (patch repair protein)